MPDGLYDVAIIGGGPAGSTAAYHLAHSGAKTILIEKSSQPRYKTCGGGLVGRALRSLFVDPDGVIQRKCYQVSVNLHDIGLFFSTVREEPVIAMAMREEFDFKLLSAAKNAGTEVITECELLELVPGPNSVQLRTTARTLSAKFVIGADGVTGTTSRKAGWVDLCDRIPALEYELFVGDQLLDRFGSSAQFDIGIVPYGYAWVFPKRKHLSVGVLTTREHSVNLNTSMKNYLRFLCIGNDVPVERHGFMIPSHPRRDTFVRNRVMLIGDAAGFVDPLTGEGISFALKSGELAARALLESNFGEHRARICYQRVVEELLLPELRYGRILAKIFYEWPLLRNWLFRNHGPRLTEAITTVMMGEKSYQEIFVDFKNYLTHLNVA